MTVRASPEFEPLDGLVVANFVLDYCEAKGSLLTQVSLQKIVYLCHVYYLVSHGHPLIRHQFEAWEYGPVLPYLYREFKMFERSHITSRAKKLDLSTGRMIEAKTTFSSSLKIYLQQIVEMYRERSPSELIRETHVENGPWWQAWNHNGKANPGMPIDNDAIMAFYTPA